MLQVTRVIDKKNDRLLRLLIKKPVLYKYQV